MSPNTACSVTGRLRCYILQGIICSYLYANSLSFLKIIFKNTCVRVFWWNISHLSNSWSRLILNLIGISLFLFIFFLFFKTCIFNFVNKAERIKDISGSVWISWTIFQTACFLSFALNEQYLNSLTCNSFGVGPYSSTRLVYFLCSNF